MQGQDERGEVLISSEAEAAHAPEMAVVDTEPSSSSTAAPPDTEGCDGDQPSVVNDESSQAEGPSSAVEQDKQEVSFSSACASREFMLYLSSRRVRLRRLPLLG